MPKPRQGTEVKEHCSIRLEPQVKKEIVKRYKHLQKFIDEAIKRENICPDKEKASK